MRARDFETLASIDDLCLRQAMTPGARADVLTFIRGQFRTHYGAEVEDDAPTLVGGFDASGNLIAAFGLRTENDGFFSGHYLTESVPETLARHFATPVALAEVVEVAHLCAARPGFLCQLMPLLAVNLERRGYRYLVCTATRRLGCFFRRKGLPAVMLAEARPDKLPLDQRERWGRYYENQPSVIAGDLRIACALLEPDVFAHTAVKA